MLDDAADVIQGLLGHVAVTFASEGVLAVFPD